MTYTGVTGSIGGSELFGGGCFTGIVSIAGVTLGMVVAVTPRTYPGSGITWQGFVNAPGQVTVKVCSAIASFVTASLYDVQVSDTSGTGAFPEIVAAVNFTGQHATLNVELLDGSQPTGEYELSDYCTLTVEDPSTTVAIQATWRDASGIVTTIFPGPAPANFVGSFSSAAGSSASGPNLAVTPPSVVYALTGTPLSVQITVTPGAVGAIEIAPGNNYRGIDYAPGDTFQLGDIGDGTATGTVSTVNGSGGVLTATMSGGTTYPDRNGSSCTTLTGSGSGLVVLFHATAGIVTSGEVMTNAGVNFSPADEVTISGGGNDCVLAIDTVNANGGIVSLHIENPGSGGYTTGPADIASTTGDGSFATFEITALTTDLLFDYRATVTRNQ